MLADEIAGYKIISDLLDVYSTALVRKKEGMASNYDRLMINTLPMFYQRTELPLYNILLNTCCYVASMSDRAAILLYKKINGLEI